MNVHSPIIRFVFAMLVLAAPSLWAQDGLSGAVSRLEKSAGLLHNPFEQRLVAADFDDDQKPDGAVLLDSGLFHGQKSYRIELHVSGGNDTELSFESNEPTLAISALDVNKDGSPDIVVEQPFTHKRLHVWLNDGHGTFSTARLEDFQSSGRDGPYGLKAPIPGQGCPALYLPSKIGSEVVFTKAAAPSLGSSASGRHIRPIHSAPYAQADEPNPSRGPPVSLSL